MALPIWMDFMSEALKARPVEDFPQSPLLTNPDQVKEILASAGTQTLLAEHGEAGRQLLQMGAVNYRVMGGPTHCCGVIQLRAGDAETSSRFAGNTIDKLARSKSGEVISWCPSCFVQFSENMLPTFERATGEKPFDLTPFMRFLRGNLDRLRPFLTKRVEMTIALHRHHDHESDGHRMMTGDLKPPRRSLRLVRRSAGRGRHRDA